jgi:hypothetical protein
MVLPERRSALFCSQALQLQELWQIAQVRVFLNHTQRLFLAADSNDTCQIRVPQARQPADLAQKFLSGRNNKEKIIISILNIPITFNDYLLNAK